MGGTGASRHLPAGPSWREAFSQGSSPLPHGPPNRSMIRILLHLKVNNAFRRKGSALVGCSPRASADCSPTPKSPLTPAVWDLGWSTHCPQEATLSLPSALPPLHASEDHSDSPRHRLWSKHLPGVSPWVGTSWRAGVLFPPFPLAPPPGPPGGLPSVHGQSRGPEAAEGGPQDHGDGRSKHLPHSRAFPPYPPGLISGHSNSCGPDVGDSRCFLKSEPAGLQGGWKWTRLWGRDLGNHPGR